MLYMPGLKKLVEEAKKNRSEFLEPHRKRVEELQAILSWSNKETDPDKKVARKAEQEISKIVVNLLKIEPSHLDERWISKIVQSWMKDYNRVDDIQRAFLSQKGRDRKTPDQQGMDAKWTIFKMKIDEYIHGGFSKTDAIATYSEKCKKYRKEHPDNPPFMEHDCAYLWKMYHETAKKIRAAGAKETLPWPYYGRDIYQAEDGTYTIKGQGIVTIHK